MSAPIDQMQIEVLRQDFRKGLELVFKALQTQEGKIQDLDQLVRILEEKVAAMETPAQIRQDNTGREI
jgi:hypothetical protein